MKKFSRKTPHLSITNQLSMTDSAISKRQGDRRKHSFMERKKYCIKGQMESLWEYRISHHLIDQTMKQSTHKFHKTFFSYLKMLSIQCRKNIAVEDNKKRMNITNFINKYTNVYTYIICNKNDSK